TSPARSAWIRSTSTGPPGRAARSCRSPGWATSPRIGPFASTSRTSGRSSRPELGAVEQLTDAPGHLDEVERLGDEGDTFPLHQPLAAQPLVVPRGEEKRDVARQ